MEPISCWKQGMGTDAHGGRGDGVVDSRPQGQVLRLCLQAGIIQRLAWPRSHWADWKLSVPREWQMCVRILPVLMGTPPPYLSERGNVDKENGDVDKAMKTTARVRKRQLQRLWTGRLRHQHNLEDLDQNKETSINLSTFCLWVVCLIHKTQLGTFNWLIMDQWLVSWLPAVSNRKISASKEGRRALPPT